MLTNQEISLLVEDLRMSDLSIVNENMDMVNYLEDDESYLINYMENVEFNLYMEAADLNAATLETAKKMTAEVDNTAKSIMAWIKQKENPSWLTTMYNKFKTEIGKLRSALNKKYDSISAVIKNTKKYFSNAISVLFGIIRHIAKAILQHTISGTKYTLKQMYKPVSDGLKDGHYVAVTFYIVAVSAVAFIGSYYIGKMIITMFKGFMNRIKTFVFGIDKKSPSSIKSNAKSIKKYVRMANKMKAKAKKAKAKKRKR